MNWRYLKNNFDDFRYILISIIILNIYLLNIIKVGIFDQLINLMISFGVYNYFNENKYYEKKDLKKFQVFFAFTILFLVLYRSYWLHTGDNFIYCLFPILLSILLMLHTSLFNIVKNLKPILISLLFPFSKVLFIPLSIIISPISTFLTWLVLNTFGVMSVMKGQEIFYNNSAINITFSCSGAGQILFCFSAMLILNFCFPLRNIKLLFIQLFLAFLFTLSSNIVRLSLLVIFAYSANSVEFSMFDYLHGGSGGLFFSFISMILSCESYKRIYFANT